MKRHRRAGIEWELDRKVDQRALRYMVWKRGEIGLVYRMVGRVSMAEVDVRRSQGRPRLDV